MFLFGWGLWLTQLHEAITDHLVNKQNIFKQKEEEIKTKRCFLWASIVFQRKQSGK